MSFSSKIKLNRDLYESFECLCDAKYSINTQKAFNLFMDDVINNGRINFTKINIRDIDLSNLEDDLDLVLYYHTKVGLGKVKKDRFDLICRVYKFKSVDLLTLYMIVSLKLKRLAIKRFEVL